jgi:heme A synthase
VPLVLASLHQAMAVALFAAALFLCHRAYRG